MNIIDDVKIEGNHVSNEEFEVIQKIPLKDPS